MSFFEEVNKFAISLGSIFIPSADAIAIAVEPTGGVRAGQPVKILFDARGLGASTVTIHNSEGELLFEGGARGSIVVAPPESSWYVLTATGPHDLHEETVIEVQVHPRSSSSTRSWAQLSSGHGGS